jgi:glutamate-ammonia-ligase adenylyltransferase
VTHSGLQHQAAALAQVKFRHPEVAARNLACVHERLPEALRQPLAQVLAESPDPDTALNLFERLTASDAAGALKLFSGHHFLLHYALTVFGYSQFLGESLIRNPDIFQVLLREKNLGLTHSREEFGESFARFRSRSLETDMVLLLARFKRREYVRIMLRDVLRIATLAETTAEISALSDVLIEEALRDADMRLRNRYGPPQRIDAGGRLAIVPFTVLALGKLGGNELNYSSDVDVLYLFGDGEAPPAAPISNREYFIRLAQQLTGTLAAMSHEGVPFRIDLRLRPQGGEGEPAIGIAGALQYYEHSAADWERQALIKLRHSAGDQTLARQFIRQVQPFVYTEKINFAAIETALQAREKIGARRRKWMARHGEAIDVKLDRGGIRDIEFLVQCLQRVYGGAEKWLRSGGTLFSLQKLHDKGHIGGHDYQELTGAYEFLRTVEHRMQMRHGQQTHRLPAQDDELQILARMVMTPSGEDHLAPGGDRRPGRPEELISRIRQRMSAVAEIYSRIVDQQQVRYQSEEAEFRLRSASEDREKRRRQIPDRLAVDAPALYEFTQRPELNIHTRRNLDRFLASAFTSSERYAAVVHAPAAITNAVEVFALSDYLTDILIRHPEEIATLETLAAEGGTNHSTGGGETPGTAIPESGALFSSASAPQAAVESASEAGGAEPMPDRALAYLEEIGASRMEMMALLRERYRARVFASGARDVMRARPVWEGLTETTEAADEVIRAALAILRPPAGFAVFALGRLGTREHDLLSDADLLFVSGTETDPAEARRVGVGMVDALSAYTREGAVFPVDARLRPHGGEGELVVRPEQLEVYLAREAQVWEALTYTKLRHIAGGCGLAGVVRAMVSGSFGRFAADSQFVAGIREMRTRLEKTDKDAGNLKNGPGGLYDIDFLVTMRLVRHGIDAAPGTLRQRLSQLMERGLLGAEDGSRLQLHTDFLRTVEHAIRLVTGRARKTLPVSGPALAACEQLCGKMLQRDFPGGLESELQLTMIGVREIYERLSRQG